MSANADGPSAMSSPRSRAIVAIAIIFLVIATVAVAARFWARRLKRQSPALDDWLIVAGLIFYYASAVLTILQTTKGRLGHHLSDGVTPNELVINGKIGTYEQFVYALTMGCVRWSICVFIYRIFVTKFIRRALIFVMVVNGIWTIFSIVIVAVRCIPFSKNWNLEEPGYCLAQVPIVVSVAAWGLAVEVVIWLLPIPATWQLQMPTSAKVAVSAIFGLGVLDIGVGVARVVTTLQVQETDPLWSESPALEWLAIEPSIAILVACLCVCRPLLEKLLPERLRQTISSGVRRTTNRGRRSNAGYKETIEDDVGLVENDGWEMNRKTTTVVGGVYDSKMDLPTLDPSVASGEAVHVRRDIKVSAGDWHV